MIIDQPSIQFISKDWGFEKHLTDNDNYCGKLLYLVKHKKCSFHYHRVKDETLYLYSGKIRLFYLDLPMSQLPASEWHILQHVDLKQIVLKPGDNFCIPPGRVHQLVGIEDSQIFEFSVPRNDEKDVYRIR